MKVKVHVVMYSEFMGETDYALRAFRDPVKAGEFADSMEEKDTDYIYYVTEVDYDES